MSYDFRLYRLLPGADLGAVVGRDAPDRGFNAVAGVYAGGGGARRGGGGAVTRPNGPWVPGAMAWGASGNRD